MAALFSNEVTEDIYGIFFESRCDFVYTWRAW